MMLGPSDQECLGWLINFIAIGNNISFAAPTELRPKWRLIQTEGEAVRILAEAENPYMCVYKAAKELR